MTTEDRRRGKLLPAPVTPPTTVCFTITVPNAVQYRAALLGQLNILGEWHTWDHPTDGTNCADCEEAAQLWRDAIANATFSDECGDEMSCDDVADCIETDANVQSAINNLSSSISTPGVTATPGQPMTTSQVLGALNPMDDCDLDVLWAQCVKLVEYATTAGTDLLEKIEQYSNAVEAGQFIEMIPVIGTLMDESQLDKVLDFINWTQENVQEAYQSALDEPLKEAIACAIFCAAKPDCVISVELLWEVMNVRLGGLLNPSEITDFAQLADAMVQTGLDPALPVDLWLAFLFGGAKFAGYLGVRGIDQTLRLALLLAADEPSNNWMTLCIDCTNIPGFVVYGTEATTVIEDDGVFTITGGFIGGGGVAYIYVGASTDGVGVTRPMEYTALTVDGVSAYDWGYEPPYNTTIPPTSAPPPDVRYAGGNRADTNIAALSIVIETTMPFQGVINS